MWGYLPTHLSHLTSREKEAVEITTIKLSPKVHYWVKVRAASLICPHRVTKLFMKPLLTRVMIKSSVPSVTTNVTHDLQL